MLVFRVIGKYLTKIMVTGLPKSSLTQDHLVFKDGPKAVEFAETLKF